MKKITRDSQDRIIAGLCSGIAEYFSIDVTVVRILWILFTLVGGSGIIAYLIGVVLIPEKDRPAGVEKKTGIEQVQENTGWYFVLLIAGLIAVIQNGHVVRTLFNVLWGTGTNLIAMIILLFVLLYKLRSKITDKTSIYREGFTRQLHLSVQNKQFFGVCGGIAETFELDPQAVRFIWVLATIMSGGIGVVLYLLLVLILPEGIAVKEAE